jgi:hypothetical protein
MRQSIGVAAAIVLAAAGAAKAGYTPVGGPASGELGHQAIFQGVFGGTWSTTGLNHSGNGFTATRLHDYIGANGAANAAVLGLKLRLDGSNLAGATAALGSETVTDAVWEDGTRLLSARAVYSGASQRLDWRNNSLGGAEGTLVGNLSAQSNILTGPTVTAALNSADFEFIRDGNGAFNTGKFYSNQTRNAGESTAGFTDFMVTYHITGTNFDGLMIFFEDRALGNGGDGDFNDLAVLIVPLPPAAWAGLGSLACVAGFGVIRRRRLAAN